MDYTRKTGVRVKISYRNSITWFTKAHEGYKCTDLRRYLINFFPPEINSINALQIFLDKMFHGNLKNLRLIDVFKLRSLTQTLRKQFNKLSQKTHISLVL